jgi:two-component system, cell cycle sensor histidine kinase and response regulator CckA
VPEATAPRAAAPPLDANPTPAARPSAAAPPGPTLGAGAEIAGIVLLVEDEAPVRAFAARALRLQGYRVLEAEDGEQALEVLADPGLVVDIFVSDVIMPGRDGPTWVAEALRTRPGTPVVFISGYIEDTLTEALGRTPQAVFLEKPFSLDALCRTIAAQMDRLTT